MKTKPKIKDIFVSEISFDATEEDILKLFSVCGTVRSINMVTDKRTDLFRGVAFVCMSNDAETKEAINMLDGTRLLDRCIVVSAAKTKEELAITAPIIEAVEKKTRRKRVPKGRKKIK